MQWCCRLATERQLTNYSDKTIPKCNDRGRAPGGIFSYCVRARAYTHVLARVYSTRAT